MTNKLHWRNYQEWEAWHQRTVLDRDESSSLDRWIPGYECLEDDYSEDSMP